MIKKTLLFGIAMFASSSIFAGYTTGVIVGAASATAASMLLSSDNKSASPIVDPPAKIIKAGDVVFPTDKRCTIAVTNANSYCGDGFAAKVLIANDICDSRILCYIKK